MIAEPQKEHQWLQQLLGEWTMESECSMGPEQPEEKNTGAESVRPLGGLWVLCEGQGSMPGGGEAHMLMTLGFDPRTGRFVGSWVGSMMTHMWVYDGELDETGTILTLSAEGPGMSGDGQIGKYRDVIEIVNPDHRVLRSYSLGADGQWQQFMTAHYRRRA